MPSPGTVTRVALPDIPNVRVDTFLQAGSKISVYYDPLVAKVIAWGENRQACIETLRQALSQFEIEGVFTNLSFLHRLVGTADFRDGHVHTRYIDENISALT